MDDDYHHSDDQPGAMRRAHAEEFRRAPLKEKLIIVGGVLLIGYAFGGLSFAYQAVHDWSKTSARAAQYVEWAEMASFGVLLLVVGAIIGTVIYGFWSYHRDAKRTLGPWGFRD